MLSTIIGKRKFHNEVFRRYLQPCASTCYRPAEGTSGMTGSEGRKSPRQLFTNNKGMTNNDHTDEVHTFQQRSFSSSTTTPSSVSEDEVNKFSSMAEKWWELENNPLISMNPIRMSFIVDTLRKQNRLLDDTSSLNEYVPLKGLKALDVGCGGGLLSESLARLGADVTAIDPSKEVANAAKVHSESDTKTQSIDYRGGTSVEDLENECSSSRENNELYDIVCILEVIEHATDPQSLVQSAASLLKKPTDHGHPGGILFISTVNRTVKSYAIAIAGGEYITRKLPIGTHSWQNFKSPSEVLNLVSKVGLESIDVKGMILQPPFFDMRWELNDKDFDVNWIGAYTLEQ